MLAETVDIRQLNCGEMSWKNRDFQKTQKSPRSEWGFPLVPWGFSFRSVKWASDLELVVKYHVEIKGFEFVPILKSMVK